jgi:hypothetical protein
MLCLIDFHCHKNQVYRGFQQDPDGIHILHQNFFFHPGYGSFIACQILFCQTLFIDL